MEADITPDMSAAWPEGLPSCQEKWLDSGKVVFMFFFGGRGLKLFDSCRKDGFGKERLANYGMHRMYNVHTFNIVYLHMFPFPNCCMVRWKVLMFDDTSF
jgi:hypothetical protein